MAIYIGNNSLSAAKLGTTNISSIWLGDVKLWPTIVYYKFQAEYSDGKTYDVECDGSGTLGTSQTKPSGYDSSAMTEAIIGDCVDYMSYSTFGQCYSLSSVTLPNSLKTIGDNAFDSCSGLTSITIPNSVSSITSYAFTKCSGITNVVVPNSVTNLGTGVFQRCSGLQSATLPSGLTSIPNNLFRYCSSLSSVTIPSSVITIGGYAFAESKITDITIPNGVTSIGNSAFNLCRSLTSVTVEATTPPTLGTNVFNSTNNCPIYVPCDSVNAYRSASGWSTYASRIQPIVSTCQKKFYGWYSDNTAYVVDCDGSSTLTSLETTSHTTSINKLTSCIIGGCVDTIGANALLGTSTGFTSLIMGDSVKYIGTQAIMSFGNTSTSSKTFVLSKNIETVATNGIVSINGVERFEFPSLVSAGNYFLSDAIGLNYLEIGENCTSIGTNFLYYYNRYSTNVSIVIRATTPPTLGNYAFYNITNFTIYVPCDSVNAYRSASGWSTYASRIEAIPNSCVSCNWEIMSEGDEIPSNYVKGIRIPFGMIVPEGAYIGFEDEDGNIIEVAYDIYDNSWFMQYPSGSEQLVFDGDYAEVNFSDYGVGDATVTNSSIPFECILCIVP